MKIVELTCTKCHGVMEVKEDEEKIICPFCGATNWIVESDEIRRDKVKYQYINEKEKTKADYELKKDVALYKFLQFKYILIALGVVAAIVLFIILINIGNDHAHIAPPASSSRLIGKQYTEVEHLFEDAGFVNVETNAIPDLQNAFLYDAKQDDGKVTSVSIGGKERFVVDEGFIFHHTDRFDKTEQVRITYRTFPEPEYSPEEIAADASVNADWTEKPVILSAHETGKDQFTVSWEGKAPVYIVRVDGVEKTVVADNKATFKLDNGLHTIQVVPINRKTRRDDIQNISGPITINTPVNFSLDMYHMQKDHLVAGQFSEEKKINYTAEEIYDKAPSDLKASISLDGSINLTFTDPINADGYLVSYKTDNKEYSVFYGLSDKTSADWMTRNEKDIKIIVHSDYLQKMNNPAIKPDMDYSFSVLPLKEPEDCISLTKADNTQLAAKNAVVNLKTTPVWKDAPVISSGEQTADGEITIKWTHPASELGCRYIISLRNKAVFITTGENELLKIDGTEAVIKNLQNGNYTLVVTPEYEGNKGTSSAEFTVAVNNNWSQAPEVILTQVDSKTVKAEITTIFGINAYSIKVSCGNTANLLSFVDLDYSLYGEYTVDAVAPVTEYTFVYDKDTNPNDEIKVKFDVYGIHNSDDGTVQHSATKTEQITLKNKGD